MPFPSALQDAYSAVMIIEITLIESHIVGRSQTLVVNDGTLVQFSLPVVGYEGQGSTTGQELDGTIRILPDINIFPLKTPVFFIILKQILSPSYLTNINEIPRVRIG